MMTAQHKQMYEEARSVVETYRAIGELIPEHWVEGEVRANGIRHHYYRTGGDKPALLLLHGFSEAGLTGLRVARELEGEFDVVMPDARGHGPSDGVATGYSVELLRDDAAGVIHALGLDHPEVIGFSMGGTTALHLAAAYPELVHSFIFEGWADQAELGRAWDSPQYQAWYTSWLAWLDSLKTMGHKERMVSALGQLLPVMGGKVWPEEEYVPAAEAFAQLDLALAGKGAELWGNKDDPDPNVLLRQVRCPALVLKHEFGFPVPGAQPTTREVPSGQSNVRIVYFENTGHMIRRVAFEQFVALLRDFLSLART